MASSFKYGDKPAPSSFRAYRIISPQYEATALSGKGAELYGGRWNPPGLPFVYLASHRSLGALELLVHLTSEESKRKTYRLLEYETPKHIADRVSLQSMDPHWNTSPSQKKTQQRGTQWFQANKHLSLLVPSALIPEEQNIILNPNHPDFKAVKLISSRDFSFDPRLL